MKQVKISYFKYGLILASVLSFITLIVSFFAPVFDRRLIFMFFYTTSLNFTFFLSLSFLANWKNLFINSKHKETLFIGLTFLYSFFYIVSNLTFIFTSQSTHLQTLLFSYQVRQGFIVLLYVLIFLAFLAFFSSFFSRKIKFIYSGKKKRSLAKYALFISLFFLLFFLFIVPQHLGVFNRIVSTYNEGNPIYIEYPIAEGELLFETNSNLNNPNVIFILMDAVTFDRFGSYGYSRNVTPNMDLLASNGIVFKNAYATATHSDYSQPGYLSSRYMLVNDYRNFFNNDLKKYFVWDIFKEANYSTAYISSQNDLWAGMNNYFNFDSLDYYSHSLTDGETDYGKGLEKKDYDHKTLDKALRWMNGEVDETPFFLYLNFQATHKPLAFPEQYNLEWTDGLENDTFVDLADNALRYIDLQVAKLMEHLRDSGKIDNTVFIISSDHGHDWYARHGITGHGKSVYDEELKVPLIFYFPDLIPRVISERVSQIDVVPTILDLLNMSYEEDYFIGKSMSKNNRFFFYVQSHKYLIGMIKGDTKVIIDLNRNLAEVYDLENDPLEMNNLINSKNYDSEVLELLMWHNCQLNYFSVENPPEELSNYCNFFA
tara:strand:+ start:63 stop:1862 length:1800 start_codon:yes stop_codon:yes gene_type:complete